MLIPPCDAMLKAHISDPNSQAGIKFCINKCPYEDCIVVDGTRTTAQNASKREARKLHKAGLSNEEISSIIHRSSRTVKRYLAK